MFSSSSKLLVFVDALVLVNIVWAPVLVLLSSWRLL